MTARLQNKLPGRFYHVLTMASLVLAGESVFLPAFHLGRYFKTPLLATFNIDILQLGHLGGIYGVCQSGLRAAQSVLGMKRESDLWEALSLDL